MDKENPKAKDKASKGFSKLSESLAAQNEGAKIASNTREFEAGITAALGNDQLEVTQDVRDEMERLVKSLQGNKLQDLETQKENNKTAKDTLDALKGILENTEPQPETLEFSGPGAMATALVVGILAATAGLATGVLAGIASNAVLIIKGIGKGIAGVLKLAMTGLAKAFPKTASFLKGIKTSIRLFFSNFTAAFKLQGGKIVSSIKTAFKPLTNGIKNIKGAFNAGFSGLKSFRTATGAFGKLGFFGKIGKLMGGLVAAVKNNPITKGIRAFRAGFAQLKAPFTALSKSAGTLKAVKGFLTPIGTFAKTAFKTFGALGRVFGRLFLPIQIVMGVIDSVKGALAGFDKYKDQGFIAGLFGGLMGGISGLLQGVIGLPLDLLKDGISWIMEKFGFDTTAIDSFSFSDMIANLFTLITDSVLGFVSSIGDQIADIGIGGMVANIGIDLLKILKKIALFPLAVAAGAVKGLAAAWPGGATPGEAFMEGFNKVFTLGDATLDSMKVQGDGMDENGNEIMAKSGENELARNEKIETAAANIISAPTSNQSTNSSSTYVMNPAMPSKIQASLASR